MTITATTLYWITRLDNLCWLLAFVAIVGIIGSVITLMAYFINEPFDEEKIPYFRWGKRFGITAFVIMLIGCFVPSSREVAMFYVVPAITRSDVVREDLPELYDYGVKALKQQLQEWSEPKGTSNG